MLAKRSSHLWKPRRARLLQALVCARCAGMTTRVKNRSDEPIFHSQGLSRSASNLAGSHRRIRLREILLACLRAKRFDMEVKRDVPMPEFP